VNEATGAGAGVMPGRGHDGLCGGGARPTVGRAEAWRGGGGGAVRRRRRWCRGADAWCEVSGRRGAEVEPCTNCGRLHSALKE
jgi:hypothetical protein